MMSGKKIVVGLALASIVAMTSCTSALFFPAKPAEKAADALIDDIWPDVPKPATAKTDAKKS
jgi:hypothetical protein